jgi:hypothetical protein
MYTYTVVQICSYNSGTNPNCTITEVQFYDIHQNILDLLTIKGETMKMKNPKLDKMVYFIAPLCH